MECRTVQRSLDDYREGTVNADVAAGMAAHLQTCAACRAFARDLHRIHRAVAEAETPPLSAAQRRRLLGGRRPRGIAAGMAAGLAFAAAATVWLQFGEQATEPQVAGTEWQAHTVRLQLESRETLSGVRFTLDLPEGAELQTHPGQRRLEWEDELSAGANRLTIPLILRGQPDGELVARIEHEGRSRELRLPPEQWLKATTDDPAL